MAVGIISKPNFYERLWPDRGSKSRTMNYKSNAQSTVLLGLGLQVSVFIELQKKKKKKKTFD